MTNEQAGSVRPLLLAVVIGLATGLAELALTGIRTLGFGETMFVNPHVVWMAPVSYVIAFLPPSSILQLAGRYRRRGATPVLVHGLLAFGGWWSLLFTFYPRLSKLSILLLAAGLGAQTARILVKRAGRRRSWQVCGAVMAGVVLLAGLSVSLGPIVRERVAVRRVPAAAVGTPNVLLIILDTVRSWSTSLSGYDRKTTPWLERLGASGVVFERAYAPAPWTTPTHASLFTGQWPQDLADQWLPLRPLSGRHRTLASVMSEHGFLTAGFVGNSDYAGSVAGLDHGFQHFEDFGVSWGEFALSSALGRYIVNSPRVRRMTGRYDVPGRKTARDINRDLLDWLERRPGRPFFAFVNYYDAHEPYLPPKPFASRFDRGGVQDKSMIVPFRARQARREDKRSMSEPEITGELDAYEGAIASVDAELDSLFGALERRRLLDHTLVVVTSDHGEQFGENGFFDHGNTLYLATLHVPLVLRFPGRVPAGVRVRDPVSIRDLAATVTELAGIPAGSGLGGRSLVPRWSGDPAAAVPPVFASVRQKPRSQAWYPVAHGDLNAVIAGGWQYIRNGDGSEELFDLREDVRGTPPENRDEASAALILLRSALDSLLSANPGRRQ